MKTAPARRPPGTGTQPEALIKEARRRQRRRYVAVGVAVVAVIGSAAGVVAWHGPGSRPNPRSHAGPPRPGPIPRSVGTTVLMWPAGSGQCCGPMAVDNLSTGRLVQGQEPAISVGDYQPLLTHVGRWLVYAGDRVTAIRDDLSGTPRVLGSTPFFAPAAASGHVWLFRSRNGTQGPIRAWQVPVAGGAPSPPVTLPAGAGLIRGTDAGLLLQVPQGLALWDPGTMPKSLPNSPPGGISDGFDATARLVAYGTGCTAQATAPGAAYEPDAGYNACQMLRILDVVTGRLISFTAPPGTAGWVPNGFNLVSAISPGDQMIAAYAAMRPPGQGRVRLYLIPVTSRSGPPRAIPSSAAYLFARTAWSANGSWLLYQGPGGRLWAYQVASGKTRASSTPCCQYTVMVTAPSNPAGRGYGRLATAGRRQARDERLDVRARRYRPAMFTDHEGGVRPLVIVSVTAAADGRVTFSRAERLLDDGPGARWKAMWPPDADGLLARRADAIERRHHPSVVLEGSGTFVADDAGALPLPDTSMPADLLRTDFLPYRSPRWFAVVDGRGRVAWTHKGDEETSLLVLASHGTPLPYLARLRQERIPYLIAGARRVDLRCSLAKIRTLLGAECLVSQAGGGLNGALLRAGLVDELHLITVPALIGGLGTPSVMDGPPLEPGALPQQLRTVDVQVGSHGTIWAHYEVRPGPANSRGMCG